jgi:hypothetical protein
VPLFIGDFVLASYGTGELNVNQIFKYTSIKEIFNEIIGKSAGALNVAAVEKKETQIILVTSAAGGVGKTTVAMGVAACLVQNYKRVLYIEAASLQSAQYMLENDTPISSPDIYTKLLNPSDSIYADIKHVIRKEVFSYIPPFKAAIMSVGLSKNIYMDGLYRDYIPCIDGRTIDNMQKLSYEEAIEIAIQEGLKQLY